MSRYIDYDALDYKNWHMIGKPSDFIDGVVYMAERIEEAPSIDIVRCKECEKLTDCRNDDWQKDVIEMGYIGWCNRTSRWGDVEYVKADDFCSRGERREP